MTFRFFNHCLRVALCLVAGGLFSAQAGNQGKSRTSSIETLANNEIIRKQEDIGKAEALMQEGRKALGFKEYETAYVKFLDAVELLPPDQGKHTIRRHAVTEFSAVAMEYADFLIKQGRFPEAEKVAKTVLLPEFNPTYKPAVRMLANLEQPDYYNKTVTPQFAAKRDQVDKLFQEAEGFYSSARFDLATKRYNQILEIDRYNKAAREGLERTDLERQKYYTSSYNETRSRMLWEVSKAWETPVRSSTKKESILGGADDNSRGTQGTQAKLNRIIIPKINLTDTSLQEAVAFLHQQSIRLDTSATEDGKKGVNIVIQVPPDDPAATAKVTLALNQVPLYEALRYVAELSNLRVKIEPYAVSLVPLSVPVDALVNKEYRVPPGFIPLKASDSAAQGFAPRGDVKKQDNTIAARSDAKTFLEENGITFPEGSSAQYVATGSKLLVRNTIDNIELIDSLVNATVGVAPRQVEIQTKFLEVSQNNLAELGFDWLLGPLAIGTTGAYMTGGDTTLGGTMPFTTTGMTSVTSGLRTGSGSSGSSAAITPNGISQLLASGTGASLPAPGIFGVAGIFNSAQFQVLIRALDQKKGIDLLSAPKVTTKSGQSANVKIIRKFIYPSEYTPPTISTAAATTSTTFVDPRLNPPASVTPAFPNTFAKRDTGVILVVEPVIGNDAYTIDLSLKPEVVEFEGFINYGSPINGVSWNDGVFTDGFGIPVPASVPSATVLTANNIPQPVFNIRKVTTNVTIWDGATVSIGGLMREDTQKVQDKVPILGDVPLAGRLFRSTADQKIKRNLIIFVTANIIDAEGRPIRRTGEEEDGFVEPLGLPEPQPGPKFPSYKGGGMTYK